MSYFTVDEKYMARCLYLAKLGMSHTAPNPMVGAVIVHKDTIIGEGYHQKYGSPHAEPNAIHSVKDKSLLKESTIYVSLEPCSHWGKTPPCADLIVKTGIPKVVIATLDPNPKVSGQGVKILKNAGIEVSTGILAKEAQELNKNFICYFTKKRPYITLKWAQTADGFIDKVRKQQAEKPLKISNPVTEILVHKLRAENMAIMAGTNTLLLDNPSLTLRKWAGKSPIRIATDRYGKIPHNFNIKSGKEVTYIFTEKQPETIENTEFIKINFDNDDIDQIIDYLYNKNINSLLVEGGTQLINSFLKKNLWDEINIEISPLEIKNGIAAPEYDFKNIIDARIIDKNQWIRIKNANR